MEDQDRKQSELEIESPDQFDFDLSHDFEISLLPEGQDIVR